MSLTPQDNTMTYSIWVTHRENWQDVTKPFNARTELIKYMKLLMVKMGLTFTRLKQPVQIVEDHNVLNETTEHISAPQSALRHRCIPQNLPL